MARSRIRRTTSRQTTPQSPPRQSVSVQLSPETRRSTRSKSRDTVTTPVRSEKPQKPLPALLEETDLAEVEDGSSESSIGDEVDEDSDISLSSDIASEDEEETQLSLLDKDSIISSIDDLHRDASRILAFFSTKSIAETVDILKSDQTAVSKRFQALQAHFELSSQPFRNSNFLRVNLILRRLAGDQAITDGPWRPDAILYTANLSIFLSTLVADGEGDVHDLLDMMYNNFPGETLLGSISTSERPSVTCPIGQTDSTINLGVSLRTHFFLRVVSRHKTAQSFDPDGLLTQTFFDEDGRMKGFENHQDDDVGETVKAAYLARIDEIRKHFSKNSKKPVDLKGLEARYPWRNLVQSVVEWMIERKAELDAQILAQGGIDAIVDRLTSENFESYEQVPLSQETEDGTPELETAPVLGQVPIVRDAPPTSSNNVMSKRVSRLKALRAQADASLEDSEEDQSPVPERLLPREILESPAAHVSAATGNSAVQDDGNVGAHDDDEDQHEERSLEPSQNTIVPTQQTSEVMKKLKQHAIQSNKENIDLPPRRFIDRQEGARRIEWSEALNKGKRPRVAANVGDAEDEDEEDDFENDARPQKRTRTVRQIRQPASPESEEMEDVVVLVQKGPSRIRPPTSAQPEPSRSTLTTQEVRRQDGATVQPSSSAPVTSQTRVPPAAAPDSASQHVQAQHAARANVSRIISAGRAKQVQSRRPWSQDEVERLIDLMEAFGCKWAEIIRADRDHLEGPLLQERGQVGLKDKARNLKLDFLKGMVDLPDYLHDVTMKQSDIRKLEELNIVFP